MPKQKIRQRPPKKKKTIQFDNCCMCGNISDEEDAFLYAFDFDHTIVDQNSDIAMMELIHDPIPNELQTMYNGSNWEEYMEAVFKFVAEQGATFETIAEKIHELKPTKGMPHLLHRIIASRAAGSLNHRQSKLIIVSDANSYFIQSFLLNLDPPVVPDGMITNKAEKSPEGYLKLKAYEHQSICPFCPANLCKGAALSRYISKRGPFTKVYYTGDGVNDICPGMRLSEDDILFVRRNFGMHKIIMQGTCNGKKIHIQAKIILWDDALTIEKYMEF